MSSFLMGVPGKIKTLLDRLTSTRAEKLDKLDQLDKFDDTISSRAPASTALLNTTWSDQRAVNIDATISSRAPASTALLNTTWSDQRAVNIDATISSRAPASTALLNTTWTDPKAANIDATISSRAPASTALLNTTWTDQRADALDALIESGSITTAIASINTRTDVTLSSRSTNIGAATAVWENSSRILTGGTQRGVFFNTSSFWVVPEGVTCVLVTMIGGGGGGGYDATNGTEKSGTASSGFLRRPVIVIPGESISLLVGVAGLGRNVALGRSDATDGGTTTFKTLTSWGGMGGRYYYGVIPVPLPSSIAPIGTTSAFGEGGKIVSGSHGTPAAPGGYGAAGGGSYSTYNGGDGTPGFILIEY